MNKRQIVIIRSKLMLTKIRIIEYSNSEISTSMPSLLFLFSISPVRAARLLTDAIPTSYNINSKDIRYYLSELIYTWKLLQCFRGLRDLNNGKPNLPVVYLLSKHFCVSLHVCLTSLLLYIVCHTVYIGNSPKIVKIGSFIRLQTV